MRFCVAIVLCLCAWQVHALESLRVGNQLIVVGDRAAKVKELLGNPASRSRGDATAKRSSKGSSSRKGKVKRAGNDNAKGEQWQYRRNGHTLTFIFADGKVTHIDDVAR